jgi:two-component system sensor histidine kinase KdpD
VPNFNLYDVNDLINSALRDFDSEQSRHEITVIVPEKMPLIKIDFGLMEQVIKNLLQNALIYTQEDSKIEVQASSMKNFHILLFLITERNSLIMMFRIYFEKFYRVNNKIAGGTGWDFPYQKELLKL